MKVLLLQADNRNQNNYACHLLKNYIYLMQTVLITGGTGFIGRMLTNELIKEGYQVIILSRSARNPEPGIRYATWDIDKGHIDQHALRSADFIIHLAGAGVMDKRWSKSYKKEIVDSRVETSRLIVENLRTNPHQVQAIISSSAIGWYGPDRPGSGAFTEQDPPSDDYLGYTCQLWEESIGQASALGIRVCKIRTGIVLGKGGGALSEFIKPLRFGIAGILGSGRQMVSWIHAHDLCRIFVHAIQHTAMEGSYNAVAPQPVSNRNLVMTLARATRKNIFLPLRVPSFILKLILGEQSIEVLKSATVSADKIKGTGFVFRFPNIETAIADLTSK